MMGKLVQHTDSPKEYQKSGLKHTGFNPHISYNLTLVVIVGRQ